jgi:hypothetical protein
VLEPNRIVGLVARQVGVAGWKIEAVLLAPFVDEASWHGSRFERRPGLAAPHQAGAVM